MIVRIQLAAAEVDALVYYAASIPVVRKWIAKNLGVGNRARKVNVRYVDGSHLSVRHILLHIKLQVFYFIPSPTSAIVLCKFSLDAEVLYIANKDCILSLSWLMENGFRVDMLEGSIRNAISGLGIPPCVRWIPSLTVSDSHD